MNGPSHCEAGTIAGGKRQIGVEFTMRNILAMLVSLIAFAVTVVVVNAQGAAADAPLSFDIRNAAEAISSLADGAVAMASDEYELPYSAQLGLGALILAIPSIIVFSLLSKRPSR